MDPSCRHAARQLAKRGAARRLPPGARRSHARAVDSLKEPTGAALSAASLAQNFTSTFQHSRETHMHQLLTSIVLCLVAHTAAAQCVDTAPLAAQVHAGADLVRTTATTGAAPLPRPAGGDLIKTAAAGPREVALRPSPSVSGPPQPQPADEEDESRRTGPAMLIAALAVMTAIALRRSGGLGQ